jgi:4-hydroxybenzoyl-CoA reductase subunit beta
MLRLPSFRYHAASSLADAAARLADSDPAAPVRLLAGGTDLLPNLKRRHEQAATVIGLGRLEALRGIGGEVAPWRDAGPTAPADDRRELRIGAMTTLSAVAADPTVRVRYPGFARAVQAISSPVLRNQGTLGGNLCLDTRCTYYNQNEEWRRSIDFCMKQPGTRSEQICWVAPGSPRCWAISATDAAPMLTALGARVRLVSRDGERTLAVGELYRDDGIHFLTKRREEVLTDVLLPAGAAAPQCRTTFWKLRRRGSIDFAVLSVAVAVWVDPADPSATVRDARVVLGAVASAPLVVPSEALVGQPLSAETIGATAAAARKLATPMDNTDFQAKWRGVMVERYVDAALREAAGLPVERLPPQHV